MPVNRFEKTFLKRLLGICFAGVCIVHLGGLSTWDNACPLGHLSNWDALCPNRVCPIQGYGLSNWGGVRLGHALSAWGSVRLEKNLSAFSVIVGEKSKRDPAGDDQKTAKGTQKGNEKETENGGKRVAKQWQRRAKKQKASKKIFFDKNEKMRFRKAISGDFSVIAKGNDERTARRKPRRKTCGNGWIF